MISLERGDVEPFLELQGLLDKVYEQAGFDLTIDYSQVLIPVLSDNLELMDFPFAAARRITSEEVAAAKVAVKEQSGIELGKQRGRPPKPGA